MERRSDVVERDVADRRLSHKPDRGSADLRDWMVEEKAKD